MKKAAGKLDARALADVASGAGFQGDDLAVAVAVALAESGGDPSIVGDKTLAPTKGPSVGLWQINIGSLAHPEYDAERLKDPAYNAKAAYAVYVSAGQSFRPWSTFLYGQYNAFLDEAYAATGVQNA